MVFLVSMGWPMRTVIPLVCARLWGALLVGVAVLCFYGVVRVYVSLCVCVSGISTFMRYIVSATDGVLVYLCLLGRVLRGGSVSPCVRCVIIPRWV